MTRKLVSTKKTESAKRKENHIRKCQKLEKKIEETVKCLENQSIPNEKEGRTKAKKI